MVYVLDMSPLEWDRIAVPSQNLWQKLVDGVPLQQSDIPVRPQLVWPLQGAGYGCSDPVLHFRLQLWA